MRKLAVVAILVLSIPVLDLAHAAVNQTSQGFNSEQEIISLSRLFARETVLTHQERAETLDIYDIKVRINGNTASFTSRADLKGQNRSGETYSYPHQLRVELVKREEDWQVVRGQWRKL
jgi:hypothetical protein